MNGPVLRAKVGWFCHSVIWCYYQFFPQVVSWVEHQQLPLLVPRLTPVHLSTGFSST